MPVAAAIVGSSLIGAIGANKAAKAQGRAADQQLELQREIYDDTTSRFKPIYDDGSLARQAYMYEMGLGPAPTIGGSAPQVQTITTPGGSGEAGQGGGWFPGPLTPFRRQQQGGAQPQQPGSTTQYRVGGQTFGTLDEANAWAKANPTGGTAYQGFTATPGYQFRVDQGTDAVNALAGARGGLNSGRTMQDLMKFGQGIASEEYGGYMNRLAGLTDMGVGAAGNQAQAGNAFASGASAAIGNKGNAQAAGYAGMAGAIQGGIGQGISAFQYQNALSQGMKPMGYA